MYLHMGIAPFDWLYDWQSGCQIGRRGLPPPLLPLAVAFLCAERQKCWEGQGNPSLVLSLARAVLSSQQFGGMGSIPGMQTRKIESSPLQPERGLLIEREKRGREGAATGP